MTDQREILIAEAVAMISLTLKRLGELNRDDEAGIRVVLANARELLSHTKGKRK